MSASVKAESSPAVSDSQDTQSNPVEVISDLRLVHGALDFVGDSVVVGFRVPAMGEKGLTYDLFTVKGDEGSFEVIPRASTLKLGTATCVFDPASLPPLLGERWSHEQLQAFLEHPSAPENLYEEMKAGLERHIDLTDCRFHGLLTAWAVSTYFTPLFTAVPFLLIFGPKESGKSKLLELLRLVSFNACKLKDISVPALGDVMNNQRGALMVDQAEGLSASHVGMLSDSYKSDGGKRRVVSMSKGVRGVLEFSTFGFKAFATTRPLDRDLVDRCCRIPMHRSLRQLEDLVTDDPIWSGLRDQVYRFMLCCWKNVRSAFRATPSQGNRRGELWRPLAAVLCALGVEEQEVLRVRQAFDLATGETRDELSLEEEALFQALIDRVHGKDRVEVDAVSLLKEVSTFLHEPSGLTPPWLGLKLDEFSLYQLKRRKTRRKIVHYTFEEANVLDLASRYLGAEYVEIAMRELLMRKSAAL